MTVKTGSDRLKSYQEAKDATFQKGKFIPYISLIEDGDRALFRIVSEHDDAQAEINNADSVLTFGEFHRKQFISRRGKTFFKEVLCGYDFNEDTGSYEGVCDQCDTNIAKRTKFMLWVYVYTYYHRNQNTDLTSPYEPVQVNKEKCYKEPINAFQVWQDGYYMEQLLRAKIDEHATLLDRDYLVRRHGVRRSNKVTRSLTELNPNLIENVVDEASGQNIMELALSLPSLVDIAEGKIETMDGHISKDEATAYEEVDLEFPEEDVFGTELEDIEDLPF